MEGDARSFGSLYIKPMPKRIKLPPTVVDTPSISPRNLHKVQFKTTARETASLSSTRILDLPENVLARIYQDIDCPRTQIALALSCRRMLATASLVDLSQCLRKHAKGRCSYSLVMKDLHSWMPSHLQLCHSCWKYLPKHCIWRDRAGKLISQLQNKDWLWAVMNWTQGGRICPRCQVFQDVDTSGSWIQCWPDGFVREVMVKHEHTSN